MMETESYVRELLGSAKRKARAECTASPSFNGQLVQLLFLCPKELNQKTSAMHVL